MYFIFFRLRSSQRRSGASLAVGSADLPEVIHMLEAANAQYKVYQDTAYLPASSFGLGETPGWLAEGVTFDY